MSMNIGKFQSFALEAKRIQMDEDAVIHLDGDQMDIETSVHISYEIAD